VLDYTIVYYELSKRTDLEKINGLKELKLCNQFPPISAESWAVRDINGPTTPQTSGSRLILNTFPSSGPPRHGGHLPSTRYEAKVTKRNILAKIRIQSEDSAEWRAQITLRYGAEREDVEPGYHHGNKQLAGVIGRSTHPARLPMRKSL
jgi:hypothetical protein